MLRRTSKSVKEQVDKMRLTAVVLGILVDKDDLINYQLLII